MSMNSEVYKDTNGDWWLKFDKVPGAIAYEIKLPWASDPVQVGKNANTGSSPVGLVKLGKRSEPFDPPQIGSASPGVYETAKTPWDEPPPPMLAVSTNIKEGQVLSNPIEWSATPSGSVDKVDFNIDGFLEWTEKISPYIFNGDGKTLDPATLGEGDHTLEVVATSGSTHASTKVKVKVDLAEPPPVSGDKLLFMPKLGPATDTYLNTADAARKADVNKKLDLPMVYVANWNSWLENQQYLDPAAIYNPNHPAHAGYVDPRTKTHLSPEMDALVLKDSAGNPLAIPWGSKNSSGEYPQWAANQSDPKWVQMILDRVAALLAKGHKGPHLDDVNLPMSLSGTPAGAMADKNAQKDAVCKLVEAIRAKYPNIWISANTRWFDSPNHDGVDPYVERIAKAVNMVSIERGINDAGLTAGTGVWSIDRIFKYATTIHSYGCSVWWMSYATSDAEVESNCAAFWMTWQLGDSLSGGNWWQTWPAVYDRDIGLPKGPYTYSGGVHRREFTKGYVTLDDSRQGKVVKTL